MDVKFFATTWGLEYLTYEEQFRKISEAGYYGVETGRIKSSEINQVLDLLEKYNLQLICQQWTEGNTSSEHFDSFLEQAEINIQLHPLAINSHTGKDHLGVFSNLKLLKSIKDYEEGIAVPVYHETHRGRFAFAAHVTSEYLEIIPDLKLTADFSHWCCVSESYLEDQQKHLQKAFRKSHLIHARIGSTQAAQVNDPQSNEWEQEREIFLKWWKSILAEKENLEGIFPITCEFGPWPYMPTAPFTNEPLSSQWEANIFMKDWLSKHL